MAFGGGAFGRQLGHEGVGLIMKGIPVFRKETPENSLAPLPSEKTAAYGPGSGALTRPQICPCLILDLLASGTVRKKISVVYKPLRLWHFAVSA